MLGYGVFVGKLRLTVSHHDNKPEHACALLYKDIADYRSSITDLDRVIEAYPGFAGAYFVRSEAKRLMGDTGSAEKD